MSGSTLSTSGPDLEYQAVAWAQDCRHESWKEKDPRNDPVLLETERVIFIYNQFTKSTGSV